MNKNKIYLKLFLIVLFGLLIRITSLDKPEGLWNDEYISWYISSKPLFSDFFSAVYKNCHMPFYYLYLKICSHLFGSEDIILRFSSVLPNIAGIILIFFTGKMLKDEKTGLLCAALAAFSGFMIYFSQEVRFYSILFLFSTFSVFFTLKLIEKQNTPNYTGFYISNLMVMLTHTIGFVFVFFNFLFLFVYLKKRSLITVKQILVIISATIAAMLPFTPFLYKTLTASYISQFWSDFSFTKLFFVFADYISPIQINLVNTPLHVSSLLTKGNKINWGYVLFAIIPMCIAFTGIAMAIIKKNAKIIILGLTGISTLTIMIIASAMGKIVLITKYSMEIYPIFVLLTAYGLMMIRIDFIKKGLICALFGLTLFYLSSSDFAPQKLTRPEGHKLVAQLVENAKLTKNDKILLMYYDADRFGKYIPLEDFDTETITKYNFQYRMLNNPPSHMYVVKEGKDLFLTAFVRGEDEFFNEYMKLYFFDRMKKGDKFALISLNSVAFIDEEKMKNVVTDIDLYNRMPFLFLIFSHIVNNAKLEANRHLKPVSEEKSGNWEIFVWEKV